MSMLDAHIPQLVASEAAFGTKAALMRSTVAQAEQAAQIAPGFPSRWRSVGRLPGSTRPVRGGVGEDQRPAGHRAGQHR